MNDSRRDTRILVVDDDPSLLELLVDTLNAIGYTTTSAGNGVEALEILKHDSFDLMITDIKMPEVDGLQLLRKVRHHYPLLPVLFITGVASQDIIGQATPDGFLAKPFRISQIEQLIEDALARKAVGSSTRMTRVLIVGEDEEFHRQMTDILSYLQFIPFHAHRAQAAIRHLEDGQIDLVVSEDHLPDMSPGELTQSIRKRFPRTRIILSGNKIRLEAKAAPDRADGYLSLPLDASHLIGTIQKTLYGPSSD